MTLRIADQQVFAAMSRTSRPQGATGVPIELFILGVTHWIARSRSGLVACAGAPPGRGGVPTVEKRISDRIHSVGLRACVGPGPSGLALRVGGG